MAHLSIALLGPFRVTLDGRLVTEFKSTKVRALLAYLAVEASRPHPRELLASLLWPDWPDREALSNLRYALSDLRRAIGDRTAEPPFLLITREALQFNTASDHHLDVAAFTKLTEPPPSPAGGPEDVSALEEAIALARGSFLEGFSVGDSAPFEEWALLTRERLARRTSAALHRLSAAYDVRGEYDRAGSYARRWVELEPWDEGAHRQLMRALALGGQRGAALAQYNTCCRLLAEELGVEPAEETTALYQMVRDGTLEAPVTPTAPPAVAAEPPAFLVEEEPAEAEPPVFVARERELAQLDGYLREVLAGRGRVVFVTGEAGSGKTALIQEFVRRAQETHPDLIVAGGDCNAHTGIGDPYLPFREILGLLTGDVHARWAAGALTREHARRLWHMVPLTAQALVEAGPDLIGTFLAGAALMERGAAYGPGAAEPLRGVSELESRLRRQASDAAPSSGSPTPQQSDLLEQVARVLGALTRQVPLVLVVDDLQWADLGSISLLFHLGRGVAGSRMLLVGAFRSEEVALGREGARHPLEPVVNELQREFGETAVDVDRAESRDFLEALLDSEPNELGVPFRQMLFQRTRGHPLSTVELLRSMQERGDLVKDAGGRWVAEAELDWETVPARVEAAVGERIGRLPGELHLALVVASVEGEDFTAEVVARVLGTDERELVRRLSSELDRRHRLIRAQSIQRLGSRRVSRYRFRHYLFQKYLYDSLDEVERSYLHEDVGTALEALYGDEPGELRAIALRLARHFQEAGLAEKAIHYLHQAGEKAVHLSAYQEGIAHLERGLALLRALPDSPERAQQELALQLTFAMACTGVKGNAAPEVEQISLRALDLSRGLGKTSELCQVLGGLTVIYYVRADHRRARELAEEAFSVAQQAGDPLLVALGHWHLGIVLFALGEYTAALGHLEQMIAYYRPEVHHRPLVFLRGSDTGLSALAYLACCLWCLGYPEQALRQSRETLARARELGHPFSLADVVCYAGCLLSQMRRDALALKDDAEELMELAREKVPAWTGEGTAFRGAALAWLGEPEEAIPQIRDSMAENRSRGIGCYFTSALGALAEAQAGAGRPQEGLITLDEALARVEGTGERYWEAELVRLRGELLRMQGDDAQAEASFQGAIEVARRQEARSWELRAAVSLARLWESQGRAAEARAMLAPIYDWFSEGFDTPDLKTAAALLAELGCENGSL